MILKEILPLNEPLKNLCGKRLANFKTARALSKILKKVEDEVTFYSTEYKKLLDEYAKKDEQGNLILHKGNTFELKNPEARQKFEQESKDLLETDVGAIDLVKIDERDFTNVNDFPTAQEMNILETVIEWDDTTN